MKWLELLKQIAPGVMRAAVLRDPTQPSGMGQFGAIQGAASTFGVEMIPLGVRDTAEIERAVTTFARSLNDGLIVTTARLPPSIASSSSRLPPATSCLRSTPTAFSSLLAA